MTATTWYESPSSLYISYEPLAVGSTVDRSDLAKQQKKIQQADLSATK
ncbi:hypothetical protein [Paenarthrobacter nitroguajacolicus]|nr:hypothetical protein [Paenarthrobacter nitroguajacolicus]